MHELQELRRNLATLVEQDCQRRLEEAEAREREQQELAAMRAPFERAASEWMARAIPRLELLTAILPTSGVVERASAGWRACVSFASNDDFPVAASLTVTITPVDRCRAGRVEIEPLLIPMLQGHPGPMRREFDLGGPALLEIDRFLDQGMLAFARSYLRVRDPGSPYQSGRRSRREAEGTRPPAAIEEPAIPV